MFIPSQHREAQELCERAVRELILRFPFAGLVVSGEAILIRMSYEGGGTLATNGRDIFVHPEYIVKTYEEEDLRGIIFRILHEYYHCFFNHPGRVGERNRRVWNIAVDMVTNKLIEDTMTTPHDVWKTPKEGIQPPEWLRAEHTAEFVYGKLLSDLMEQGELLPKQTGFGGSDLLPPLDLSEEDKLEVYEALTAAIIQAEMVQRTTDGILLPDVIVDRVAAVKEGKVPWARLLTRRMLSGLGGEAATFSPPRKRLYPKLILPTYKARTERRLFLAIDSSASVGPELHKEFQAAVLPAAQKAKEIHLVSFDSCVREHHICTTAQQVRSRFKFLTGDHSHTSVRDTFDLIDKVNPTAIAVLTDGHIVLPEYKETYRKTVWCVPRGGQELPWGRNYIMDHVW